MPLLTAAMWIGMAAGLLVTTAIGLVATGTDRAKPADVAKRVVASPICMPPEADIVWADPKAEITRDGRVIILNAGRVLLGGPCAGVRVGDSRIESARASYQVVARRRAPGGFAVESFGGEISLVAGPDTIALRPNDLAAVLPGHKPVVIPSGTDVIAESARLQARLATLRAALAGRVGGPEALDEGRLEDIGRWMAREIAAGRALSLSHALGDELAALWQREMRATESSSIDIQVGPARERFLAGYLEARGLPVAGAAWRALLEQHQAAWDAYRRERGGLGKLERALAAVRASAGWEERFDALLDAKQRAALAAVAPAFRDWRREFVPVFRMPVTAESLEKYLDLQAAALGKDEDGEARKILREHMRACFEIHRAKPAPAEEQARVIELLIETRRRLIAEAGLSEASADFLLTDYRESEAK